MSLTRLPQFLLPFILFGLVLAAGCGDRQREAAPRPDWEIMGPGGGGSTFIPTFHPANAHRIAIRCDMTGAYLTDDGGQSWEMHNLPGGVGAFAFDPADENTVYVGAAGYRAAPYYGPEHGYDPFRSTYPLRHDAEEIEGLEPFDYDRMENGDWF